METRKIEVPVMADLFARGEKPEYLYWVGCAGAFDDRYKKLPVLLPKYWFILMLALRFWVRKKPVPVDPARRAGTKCYSRCRPYKLLNFSRLMT